MAPAYGSPALLDAELGAWVFGDLDRISVTLDDIESWLSPS
jgi:hypothetical protein